VVGVSHAEWGEEVVALYVPAGAGGDVEAVVRARVSEGLAAEKRPKRYMAVPAERWPINGRGKLERVVLRELAQLGEARTARQPRFGPHLRSFLSSRRLVST
jgi:acyl-CoA synthetase (AMP-forming)/AMP-acid ligase II